MSQLYNVNFSPMMTLKYQSENKQAMITLQEMAVFNSFYGSKVDLMIFKIDYC